MNRTALSFVLFLSLAPPAAGADGDLDPTFNDGELLAIGFTGLGSEGKAVATDGEDRILFAGNTATGALNRDFAIGRLLPDGALDSSFGDNGRVVVSFDLQGFNFDGAESVALLPDGRVVAAGPVSGPLAGPQRLCGVVRLEADGDLDPTFGGDGRVTFAYTADTGDPADTADTTDCVALAVRPDGKILVAGTADRDNPPASYRDAFVARLETDGDLDPTFLSRLEHPGFWHSDGPGTNEGHALELAPDGTIWVAGASGSSGTDDDFAIFHILENGSADGGFGTGGEVSFENGGVFTDAEDVLYAIDLDANGDLVVGGRMDPVADVPHCFLGKRDATGAYLGSGWITGSTDCAVESLVAHDDGRLINASRRPDETAPDVGDLWIRREILFSGLPDGFYDRSIDFSPGEADDGDWSWAVTLSSGRPVVVGTVAGPFSTGIGIVRLESALIFGNGFERGDASAWAVP
jgi:uncharacterized delta-60 repeat protein